MTTTSPETEQDLDNQANNLVAAGALLVLLYSAQDLNAQLTSIGVVSDDDGQPTNQIDIGLAFMKSPYRITVERVPDEPESNDTRTVVAQSSLTE